MMVDTFQQVDGVHSGFRRNHAKGVCVTGLFRQQWRWPGLFQSTVLQSRRVPVVGRFALAGGQPYAADTAQTVRSLALLLKSPNGEEWRTGMINLPVFVVNTPEAFHEFLIVSSPDPHTGKVDGGLGRLCRKHPETAAAFKIIGGHPPILRICGQPVFSLNAFRFVNAKGEKRRSAGGSSPSSIPPPPEKAAATTADKNFLFDALISQLHAGPLRWHLIIIVGQPGDPTSQAHLPGHRTGSKSTSAPSRSTRSKAKTPAPRAILISIRSFAQRNFRIRRSTVEHAFRHLLQSFTRREGERKIPAQFRRRRSRSNMPTTSTTTNPAQFAFLSRILHWLMAALLIAMLFIGVRWSQPRRLPPATRDPSPTRHFDFDSGNDTAGDAFVDANAAAAGVCGTVGTDRSEIFRGAAVHAIHRAAAGGLGDAVGGPLSDCDVRFDSSAAHSAAEAGAVRDAAQDSHGACLFIVYDISGSHERGVVPHAGSSRSSPFAHGSLDFSPIDPSQSQLGLVGRAPAFKSLENERRELRVCSEGEHRQLRRTQLNSSRHPSIAPNDATSAALASPTCIASVRANSSGRAASAGSRAAASATRKANISAGRRIKNKEQGRALCGDSVFSVVFANLASSPRGAVQCQKS